MPSGRAARMTAAAAALMVAAACVLLGAAPVSARAKCPSGLSCATSPAVPTAQSIGYAGSLLACLAPLPFDNKLCATDGFASTGFFFRLTESVLPVVSKLETPVQIRHVYYQVNSQWNAATAFLNGASPVTAAPGFGLPFANRISGAANNTCAHNIALGYALMRTAGGLQPATLPLTRKIMLDFGLDPDYMGATNFSNPADIGNAAAKATLAFALKDGWNQDGSMTGVNSQPFQDYTGFMPKNTPFQLTDITKWQPLMETNELGYFQSQTHITPQAGLITPFSMDLQSFKNRFSLDEAPYPKQSEFTKSDLKAYKDQADEVIQASTVLTDRQKMLAEFFDFKILSFGALPLIQYSQQRNYGVLALNQLDMFHAAINDAKLATWREKIKYNTVRPVSAIRYLYANTNITAYAGPYQGVKTFPGRQFQSYLRTMPHADVPSGTACICVAFAEFTERVLGYPKNGLKFVTSFTKGCSMREPGATPAADLSLSWTTTEDFIQDCAQSRMWAGVHFQQAIDKSVDMCRGIGYAAYDKFAMLRGF